MSGGKIRQAFRRGIPATGCPFLVAALAATMCAAAAAKPVNKQQFTKTLPLLLTFQAI
jgi:hypothetical protein